MTTTTKQKSTASKFTRRPSESDPPEDIQVIKDRELQVIRDRLAAAEIEKKIRKLSTEKKALKALEPIWRETKEIFELGLTADWERPLMLRGPDFVGELERLASATGDPRFVNAIRALIEHGIIDKNYNFKRWQLPFAAKHEANQNRRMVNQIHEWVKEGMSIRRACAQTAAINGLRAASFAAAIKRLQLLYSSTGKKGAV